MTALVKRVWEYFSDTKKIRSAEAAASLSQLAVVFESYPHMIYAD